jgi:glyoxylate carboligase
MTTVARQFAQTLKEIGVRYVFGVPSGNMIDYIEALREEEDIDFVLTGHETTAAFMAGVTGRLSGVPGVCFGTFGPGATNLSTGAKPDHSDEHRPSATFPSGYKTQHPFYCRKCKGNITKSSRNSCF